MTDDKAKVITVRVSPKEAHQAEIVARVEEISVNEVFRRGLEAYFEKKRADPVFVERAQEIVARDAELVKELS
jgi:hypothetical protein